MRKKVNPNNQPLANPDIDARSIAEKISDRITLLAWAEVLGALADFSYTTQEGLWDLWLNANRAAGAIHGPDGIAAWIAKLEELAGIHLPYVTVSSAKIHTQGDLKRFIRKTERNALSTAYAIIARPIIERELLPLQEVQKVFRKADSLNAEINEKRITVADLQDVLKEEMGLQLVIRETGVKLMKFE